MFLLWDFQLIGRANLCGSKTTGILTLMSISLRYDFFCGTRRMKLLDSNEIRQLRNGQVVFLLLYDKEGASTVKVNVVKQFVRDMGFDIE